MDSANSIGLSDKMWQIRAALVALICTLLNACSPFGESNGYTQHELELHDYGLFDLGTTDIDQDGLIDIFTSNHSGLQSMLLNRGDERWDDVFTTLRIDQDPIHPGLAVTAKPQTMDLPGLYIDWVGSSLVMRAHDLSQELTGRVTFYSSAQSGEITNATVKLVSDQSNDRVKTVGHFASSSNAKFSFEALHHALPISISVDQAVPLYVGQHNIPADNPTIISMVDRHGHAWGDYNGDGHLDVFITRGGLSGQIGLVPVELYDELFISQRDGGMQNVARALGLNKGDCPGRQVQWLDLNGDDRLDVYIVCGRNATTARPFPNQLWQQQLDGSFHNTAPTWNLDFATEGVALWLDVDQDHDLDVLWVTQEAIWFEQTAHGFASHSIPLKEPIRALRSLRSGDVDGDGDDDVHIVSAYRSWILFKEGSSFTARASEDIGLPSRSLAAAWVDLDNDGNEELHSIPGGVFRRGTQGKFLVDVGAGLEFSSARLSPYELTDAHLNWVDLNNDGFRDLIVALKTDIKQRPWARLFAQFISADVTQDDALTGAWHSKLFLAEPTKNNWLQINLVGSPGNRQAIGAKVRLITPDRFVEHSVGHAESSRYSQGHYRVYFGLGELPTVDELQIIWPDGSLTQTKNIETDRILQIEHQGVAQDLQQTQG